MQQPRAEDGATMVEYGFILLGIAIAVMAAAVLLGERIAALYTQAQQLFP